MTERGRALGDALERRARLAAVLPDVAPAAGGWFERWLDGVPGPEGPDGDARFTISVDPAVRTVRFAAEADAERHVASFADLLGEAAAPPEALRTATAALDVLGAERFGTWLRLGEELLEVGWSVPGDHRLATAGDLLPPGGGACGDLLELAGAWGAETVAGLVGSITPEGTALGTSLPLPDGDTAALLRAGAEAFRALGVTPLPTELEAVTGSGGPGWLRVLLEADLLAEVALVLPPPDETGRIMLADLTDTVDLLELARLEGSLGEPPCEAVAFGVGARGFFVELSYEL